MSYTDKSSYWENTELRNWFNKYSTYDWRSIFYRGLWMHIVIAKYLSAFPPAHFLYNVGINPCINSSGSSCRAEGFGRKALTTQASLRNRALEDFSYWRSWNGTVRSLQTNEHSTVRAKRLCPPQVVLEGLNWIQFWILNWRIKFFCFFCRVERIRWTYFLTKWWYTMSLIEYFLLW